MRAIRPLRFLKVWVAPSTAWKAMSSPVDPAATGAASRREHLPHREGHVLDTVVCLGTTGAAEPGQARVRRLESDHAFEVGDRDEQRTIGVAVAQQRVDLEHRMCGVTRIDARAVID